MRKFQLRSFIVATTYLFSALFIGLSLGSFDPRDPSFNSIGKRPFAENFCGLIGSFSADLLLQLLGVTAWLLVALLIYAGIETLKRRSSTISLENAGWGALLIINIASLLSLHTQGLEFYEGNVQLGGVVGNLLQSQMQRVLNVTGVALILWTVLVVVVAILFGQQLFEKRHHVGSLMDRLPRPPNPLDLIVQFGGFIMSGLSRVKVPKFRPSLVKAAPAHNMSFNIEGTSSTGEEEYEEYEEEDYDEDDEVEYLADEPEATGPPRRRKVSLKRKIQRRIANWKLPEISMLEDPPETRYRVDEKEIKHKSFLLTDKLSQFSVKGEVKGARPGPAVTLFEFKPNADVKISKITELADDLSLALSSESVRIIAPIPGRDVVGIETSNSNRETVYLKDILAQDEFWSDGMKLPLALGRQADGTPRVVDLRKMPHLLVAGTTGSGKSVFVVCALTGLLFKHSPQTLRLILIDPKQVDLAAFADVPHLLIPPVREPKKAVLALNWAVKEMEKRYRSMSKFGARGLEAFNEKVSKLNKRDLEEHELFNQEAKPIDSYYYTPQPYTVIVVEEFGDLMAVDKSNVESAVVRLAQMARASGIHLILAMQSPRKDVVTGLIKTNIPGRISFKVASKMDSRIILDEAGAERLLARGDMLFLAPSVSKPQRHHGPWVTEEEISSIMEYWAGQGEPEYDELAMRAISRSGGGMPDPGAWGDDGMEEEYDEKYDEILAWASGLKTVSASLIQRKFRLGYPRAARIIEVFEREGVVGPANGSKPRDVLVRGYDDKDM